MKFIELSLEGSNQMIELNPYHIVYYTKKNHGAEVLCMGIKKAFIVNESMEYIKEALAECTYRPSYNKQNFNQNFNTANSNVAPHYNKKDYSNTEQKPTGRIYGRNIYHSNY